MRNPQKFWVLLAAFCLLPVFVRADEVTDWNQILFQAVHAANTSPLVTTRNTAIVQVAVFDALNGIERRYTPLHVAPAALPGSSRRAAVVQAAYATLVALYPALKTTLFDPQRATSLAAISSDVAAENSFSIAHGVQWGQTVADAILSWRSTDGFTPPPPPFTGGDALGEWRPTPPGFLPGAGPQFAYMTPWVISSPSAFRPGGPPALTSSQYAADVNETKSMGSNSSATRTTDQTTFAVFWNTSTASFFWNTVAVLLGAERHTTLSDNARLLALLNTAMADAAIACWEAKYHYVAWRPITAIRLADTDGNPATDPDPAWTPLLTTPNHPEYPSGHSSVSGAAAAVLSDYFGENSAFSIYSDAAGEEGVVRSFSSFSTALEEIKNARVYGGIHFRSACNDAQTMGIAIAEYIMNNAFLPVNGLHEGQVH